MSGREAQVQLAPNLVFGPQTVAKVIVGWGWGAEWNKKATNYSHSEARKRGVEGPEGEG